VVNPSYLFAALWVLGALVWARRRLALRELWPLWLIVPYTLLMALAFYGSPRTRAPIEPVLAVAAAVGIVEWHRRHGRRSTALAVGGTAACVAAVALLAEPLKAAAIAVLRGVGVWRS
jgi:hypothetical protein